MPFQNKAKKKELQNFVDLLKQMLLVDKNRRIIPFKVLEHPFFSVEQHADSSQNMNINVEDEAGYMQPGWSHV